MDLLKKILLGKVACPEKLLMSKYSNRSSIRVGAKKRKTRFKSTTASKKLEEVIHRELVTTLTLFKCHFTNESAF